MKKKILERIISLIREEMMTTGSNVNAAGFSSKAPAKGPTAGYDPVIGKKKRYIYQRGVRKNWMMKDETK